jgi:hypothetical protein
VEDVVVKRLRTGELAVWDGESKELILIRRARETSEATVRVIRGDEFHALQEAMRGIVVLV